MTRFLRLWAVSHLHLGEVTSFVVEPVTFNLCSSRLLGSCLIATRGGCSPAKGKAECVIWLQLYLQLWESRWHHSLIHPVVPMITCVLSCVRRRTIWKVKKSKLVSVCVGARESCPFAFPGLLIASPCIASQQVGASTDHKPQDPEDRISSLV